MTKTPEMKKLIDDWLAFARENLLYAKDGMKAEYSPYHTICFLCHGSAEKYIKAYLITQGWELKKIHDLDELLDDAAEYDEDFIELFPFAEILDEYITEGRYPGDLPFESIGEDDAKEAIEAAEKIEQFVLEKLANLDQPSGENTGQSAPNADPPTSN
jgi:HEPN domain-containing protein